MSSHAMITLLLPVRATCGVVLRPHSVRGESYIQCNVNREVATAALCNLVFTICGSYIEQVWPPVIDFKLEPFKS